MTRLVPWLIVIAMSVGCTAPVGEESAPAEGSLGPSSSSAEPQTASPTATSRATELPNQSPRVIRYADSSDPDDFGIRLDSATDLADLNDAPESFRAFLRKELASDSTDRDCTAGRVIDVEAIDTRGLAVGSVNQCGGHAVLWGMDRRGWREIFGSQSPGNPCPRFAGFSFEDIRGLAGDDFCVRPELTTGRGSFAVGDTAHFRYFDVTVQEFRSAPNGVEGGGMFGARIKVCYTRRHPGSRPDGSTRTSADPWRFGWSHGPEAVWLRASHPTNRWKPVYAERILRVGECNSGWLSEQFLKTTYAAHIGMRYAPGDFNFSGTWAP